jgi:hypothetical protein
MKFYQQSLHAFSIALDTELVLKGINAATLHLLPKQVNLFCADVGLYTYPVYILIIFNISTYFPRLTDH